MNFLNKKQIRKCLNKKKSGTSPDLIVIIFGRYFILIS